MFVYVDAHGDRRVGLALAGDDLRVNRAKGSWFPGYTMEAMLRKDLQKYGVVPLPAARNATPEQVYNVIKTHLAKSRC